VCDDNEQRISAPTNSDAEPLLGRAEIVNDPRSELCGDHLTWGHTPFKPDSEQNQVFNRLLNRIEDQKPISVPDIVREYITLHFMSRFHSRQARNSAGLHDSLNPDAPLPDDLESSFGRALDGECIRPIDLLDLSMRCGMPSVEMGRYTHPWGLNMEPVKEMISAVEYAVTSLGGELLTGDEYTIYSPDGNHIRNVDSDQPNIGFLVKRKRTVGVMPDGTIIIERTSFFLRVDNESSLDKDIIDAVRNVVTQVWSDSPETANGDAPYHSAPDLDPAMTIFEDAGWLERIASSCDLNDLMPVLLKNGRTDIAIPLSTTVYCFNPDRVKQVEDTKKAKYEQEIVLDIDPEVYPAMHAMHAEYAKLRLSEMQKNGGAILRAAEYDDE